MSRTRRQRPAIVTAVALVALACFAAGCASDDAVAIRSDVVFGRSLDELGPVWNWTLARSIETGNRRLRDKDIYTFVRDATERELAARGYRRSELETPSFRLACRLGRDLYVEGFDDTRPLESEEGTLTLSAVDPSSGGAIWTGRARVRLTGADASADPAIVIEEAVRRLVANLPEQPAA